MADGFNEIRAMRIAEIMTDYSAIQTQLANFASVVTPENETLPAGVILRQCLANAQTLLARTPPTFTQPPSPGEGTRRTLQEIILDAAARRFSAWRIFQRAQCAIRAIQRRQQLLQGRAPTADQQKALAAIDNALRTDIIACNDNRIFTELSQRDTAGGVWTAEMPSLARVQQYLQAWA